MNPSKSQNVWVVLEVHKTESNRRRGELLTKVMATTENGGISGDRPESPEIHGDYTDHVTSPRVGSLRPWLRNSLTQGAGLSL